MPKALNRLRVALASDSRLFTGCAVLSTPIAWPGALALGDAFAGLVNQVAGTYRTVQAIAVELDRSTLDTGDLADQRPQRGYGPTDRTRGDGADRLGLRVAGTRIDDQPDRDVARAHRARRMHHHDEAQAVEFTPPLCPWSMRIVTAALQSPSVGVAARLDVMHGHRKVQLQVSMY